MKIYTRTGDDGSTGLFGGDRIQKDHLRIEAYGTVDETNSALGLVRAHIESHPERGLLEELLHKIQSVLFVLGADLATPNNAKVEVPRIEQPHVDYLEEQIDALDAQLPQLKYFILPGGSIPASFMHLSRTICRRAERQAVRLSHQDTVNPLTITYLNRLSDLLFVLARWTNHMLELNEETWRPE
ncbi:MAG: cob(I)yrinic acid a,c-diamide adenosyltransferase [Rhodothermaceae bacterium]|nr:cob(I)yrinic acid a,c-diamide adenosyltransferase [Rhodothermaceae bacterium]